MKLDLTKNEEQVLAETLESSLSRLQDEISHTDSRDYREALKERKEVLQNLRSKLP
ncbi:MAG: hypothetical protein OQL18_02640 [Deltaproteobacteria bacterium]|jgi:tRNA A-37 threonylcarbamoyl transferase component Bud32|nr:hypothetical protein [Deltaproteobacteria bacterium]